MTSTPAERIAKAKEKLPKLVDHLLHIISLHTNNEIVTYSPALAKQIPQSYAANAFVDFQHALHRYEVVRICAIWDGADPDKENIATIVGLIDNPEVIELLCVETASHWIDLEGAIFNPSEDLEMAAYERNALRDANAGFGIEQAARARTELAEAIVEARETLASQKLASVINLRDRSLAHSLTVTRREKKAPVEPMKYGYDRDLLLQAIGIVTKLYCWVNGTSFDFENSWRICRDNSAELWGACRFDFTKTS